MTTLNKKRMERTATSARASADFARLGLTQVSDSWFLERSQLPSAPLRERQWPNSR